MTLRAPPTVNDQGSKWAERIPDSSGSQSVVPGPVASVCPESLLEMQI